MAEDRGERTEDGQARWLVAQLVDYHRRESNPEWWAYHERRDADEETLIERDGEAIGGLEPDPAVEPWPLPKPARSLIHTLRFPPQDHKVGPGKYLDPATSQVVNVERVDDGAGILEIKRSIARRDDPLPRAVIPGKPYDTSEQRAALRRFSSDVVDRGLTAGGRYGALRGIVPGDLPRTTARGIGENLQSGGFDLEEAKHIAAGLENSHLFVQGPPGSGKTYNGARLICHLLGRGARVGVSSNSHAAIHNLLARVESFAGADPPWRGLKKPGTTPESHFRSERGDDALIRSSNRIEEFVGGGAQLVAGTAWLFARQELDSTLDYLFVDEAGQLSLAGALALGTSARNLILLGDPLQLAQVSQAIHPPSAGASVLEHLLGDHATVPRDRGLFIDQTRRMHPDVCRFISEARLESFEACGRQGLSSSGELTGTGVRYVPVVHEGNVRQAPEEAHAIASHLDICLKGVASRTAEIRAVCDPRT